MGKQKEFFGYILIYLLVFTVLLGFAGGISRSVTVVGEALAEGERHTVVIDPGHGGEDGGATSCTGVLESGINLEIALRLDVLLRFLGWDTQMIRTTDRAVYTQGDTIAAKKVSDLKQRVKIVNEARNPLLVSIHQNQFSDSRYSGAQVFAAGDMKSRELAEKLQTAFVETVNKGSNRKSKVSSGVYLMEHIRCTGILVECGFLSNPEEEARLRDGAYQKKLCCVIAAAVSNDLSAESEGSS